MSRIRITMTSPTIESAHVHPESAGIPIVVSTVCQATMIVATAYSSGCSRVKNQSNMLSSPSGGTPGRPVVGDRRRRVSRVGLVTVTSRRRGGRPRLRGNEVDTPGVPGVAAAQAPNREPATAQQPVAVHGFERIGGARGV